MAASNLDALTRDALDFYLFPLVSKQDVRSDGPMIFTSAEGMEITDAGGKTYLDMMSSHTRRVLWATGRSASRVRFTTS